MSGWEAVCREDQLPVDRGVAALLAGTQIALFRLVDGSLHAVDNQDPYSGAMVISRGIVGSCGDAPTVASPMYKQAFDLRTGRCIDDPEVGLRCYPVRLHEGVVQVALVHAERQPA